MTGGVLFALSLNLLGALAFVTAIHIIERLEYGRERRVFREHEIGRIEGAKKVKSHIRFLVAAASLGIPLTAGIATATAAQAAPAPSNNHVIDYQKMAGYQWNGYHPTYQRLTQYDND